MGGNEIRFLENEGNPFALVPWTLFIGEVGGATFLSTLFGLEIISTSWTLGLLTWKGVGTAALTPNPNKCWSLDVHVNCSCVHCGR
jgi:hypothetical protein